MYGISAAWPPAFAFAKADSMRSAPRATPASVNFVEPQDFGEVLVAAAGQADQIVTGLRSLAFAEQVSDRMR